MPYDRAMNFKGSLTLAVNALSGITNVSPTITIALKKVTGATTTDLWTTTITPTFTAPTTVTVVDFESGYIDLYAGDEFYYYVHLTDSVDNSSGGTLPYSLNITADTYLENASVDWYGEGATIDMSVILPETLQTDFLRGVFHTFNVVATTDIKRKIVYLYSKKDMYVGESMTLKLDKSKQITLVSPINSNYSIGFKADSSDINGEDPYLYELSDPESEIQLINDVFAFTFMDTDRFSTGSYQLKIPKMWSRELQYYELGASYAPKWDTKHDLRLLYYNGTQAGNWTFKATGTEYARTTYPDLLSYNATYNYTFTDKSGINGLFSTYWKDTLDQVTQNQVITAY